MYMCIIYLDHTYLTHSSLLSSTGNVPHLKSCSLHFYDLKKNPSPSNERTHLIPVFLHLAYLISQDGLQVFHFTSLSTHHLIFSYLLSVAFRKTFMSLGAAFLYLSFLTSPVFNLAGPYPFLIFSFLGSLGTLFLTVPCLLHWSHILFPLTPLNESAANAGLDHDAICLSVCRLSNIHYVPMHLHIMSTSAHWLGTIVFLHPSRVELQDSPYSSALQLLCHQHLQLYNEYIMHSSLMNMCNSENCFF